ncbi:phospholipase D-like domain-containing protein [Photobacterium profundum]|uniref:phospholipase D-like domain-containing protein n=1 Tax=Photobacterium profundum TaxID=74109 RepID=UPI003D0DA9DE
MKLSELSINALTPFVTGDGGQSPYLSGPELIKFFNSFGTNDEYLQKQGGLPNAWSRNQYAYETLKKVNGTIEFKSLIEALTDSRKVDKPDEVAIQLRDIIKHDGYQLNKNELGIYKVVGEGAENPILIEAHFQQIKSQIQESIQSAKFSIWAAVAWFTDKDLANELRVKHLEGINVRVIVNDDETTKKHGLPFDQRGIEYTKVSPNSPWGKKLMHNKFCVIDLNKVIHGSYNWTSNAQYNNESITIVENRDIAEDFARQFIQLKNQKGT